MYVARKNVEQNDCDGLPVPRFLPVIHGCAVPNPMATEMPIDPETAAGARWAQQDVETARAYAGKWLVALVGKVIAAGEDLEEVRDRAARSLGRDPKLVVVCSVSDPIHWHADAYFPPDIPPT